MFKYSSSGDVWMRGVVMVGILSYGAYIPIWRISRAELSRATGIPSMGGERAVAGWDEDSITMAVEAGLDCISDLDVRGVDALHFATTTPPYIEKQNATIIASALDLRRDVSVADFTSSLRCGITAIRAAVDAIKSGRCKRVLVTVADCRLPVPGSAQEQIYGDAGVAFLLGKERGIAEVKEFHVLNEPILGTWRRSEDRYVMQFDPRADNVVYVRVLSETIKALLEKAGLCLKDFSKIAFYANDPRQYVRAASAIGIDVKSQLQDFLFADVGVTGAAHALLLLAAALEDAKPGDRILCAGYGDGCEAFYVEVTDEIESINEKRRGVKGHIRSKKLLPTYELYMDFKRLRDRRWPEPAKASVVTYWRDEIFELPFYGMKCKECGRITYPVARVCRICGAKDKYEIVKLARRGKIFTYTYDFLLGPGGYPGDGVYPGIKAVIDLEDGTRVLLEVTDVLMGELDVDMPVEVTFRLIHQKSDYRFYYWKARPVRG